MLASRHLLTPFEGTNVWSLLEARVARTGHRPAFAWDPPNPHAGGRYSYAELGSAAAGIAAGLQARGVGQGDRVVLHFENCPEFVICWYACAAIGAIAVTTNARSSADEIEFFIGDCDPKGIITQPKFADALSRHAVEGRWLVVTGHDAGEVAERGRGPGRSDSFESLGADPRAVVPAPPLPFAPMSVQYTSGTTSRPKGVVWTHANALWGAKVSAVHEDLRPEDCHYCYMPLFHTNALSYSMLACLWVGARFVLVPKWSTSRFWDVSLTHGCTWLSLIPFSARAMESLDTPPEHKYRLFGHAVSERESDARFGVKSIGWWGMTETITHGIVGDPYTPNRPGAIGRPAPEYGVAIVDDDEEPVAAGGTGHLWIRGVRGLSVFSEYLNQPEVTAAAFRGDWFATGDRVQLHEDGHISFADRSKDMLKVGGENVAASELERVALEEAGVVEAAAVGIPDAALDEVPVLFVLSHDDPAAVGRRVEAACAAKLSDFKVPRAIYVVTELPRSTLRKTNKVALRAAAQSPANLDRSVAAWHQESLTDPSGVTP